MLIITADHGDELFEDSRCGHGGSLRDSLVRVPLLIHDPARFPGGTIVDEGAEGVDLLPTIMEAVGAPQPPAEPGRRRSSRSRRASGAAGRGRRTRRCTSTRTRCGSGAGRCASACNGVPIVDDLVDDPGETKDVGREAAGRAPHADGQPRRCSSRCARCGRRRAWGVTTNVTPAGAAALDEARCREARSRSCCHRSRARRADAMPPRRRRHTRRRDAMPRRGSRRCDAAAVDAARSPRPPVAADEVWLKGSTHVHAKPSGDSIEPIADVIKWYEDHGYDFIVAHRSQPGQRDRQDERHPRQGRGPRAGAGLIVLAGAELTHNPNDCLPAGRQDARSAGSTSTRSA